MAKDDDAWKRYREREDEAEKTGSLSLYQKRVQGANPATAQATYSTEKLDKYIEQAGTLIDQVNNLLKMYLAGIERLPPQEKRKQLDALIAQIQSSGKPTQASQFRVSTLMATYNTHKDKWDRTMRDLESGKITRRRSG